MIPDDNETPVDSEGFADAFAEAFFKLGSDPDAESAEFAEAFAEGFFGLGQDPNEVAVIRFLKSLSSGAEIEPYSAGETGGSPDTEGAELDLSTWDPEDLGDADAIL